MAVSTPELPGGTAEANEALGRVVWRASVRVMLFVVLAIAVLMGGLFAFKMIRAHEDLRTYGLVAIMVAGVGSTLCLSGAIYSLDIPMKGRIPPWGVRWTLKFGKRVFAIGQILTIGLALYAAAVLVFDLKIPGM